MPYTWTPRSSAPTNGTPPYDWNVSKQCTWYAYWRVQEGFNMSYPPVWQSGSGSSGSGKYTHARYWLEHYRDPWIPHDLGDGYVPVAGDIVVFTGTFGHCVVIEEKQSNGKYRVTDYNLMGGSLNWGMMSDYQYGQRIAGTGNCIGCLHFTEGVDPPTPTPQSPIMISIVADITIKGKEGMDVKIYKK